MNLRGIFMKKRMQIIINHYQKNELKRKQCDTNIDISIPILLTFLFVGLLFTAYTVYTILNYEQFSLSVLFLTYTLGYVLAIGCYRYFVEKAIQKRNDISYSIFSVIHIDLLKIMSFFILVNLLFIGMNITMKVGDLFFIVSTLLFLITFVYILYFEFHAKVYLKSRFRIILMASIFVLTFKILFYISQTTTIELAYIYSYITLFILYIFKSLWESFTPSQLRTNLYVSLIVFALFIPFYYFYDESNLNYKGSFIYSKYNYIEQLEFTPDIDDFFYHDESFFIQDNNRLYQYDNNYQLINTIHVNLTDVQFFYFKDNQLKAMVSIPDLADNPTISDSYYAQYQVNPDNTVTFEKNLYYIQDIIHTTLTIDNIDVTPTVTFGTFDAFFVTEEGIRYDQSSYLVKDIIVQEDNYIMFYNNDNELELHASNVDDSFPLRKAHYNNDMIIFEDLGYYYVNTIEQYLDNPSKAKQLPFFDQRIIGFLYQDGLYHFVVRSFSNQTPPYEFIIVDEMMRIKVRTEVSKDTVIFPDFYFTKTINGTYRFMDTTKPLTYHISEDARYMNDTHLFVSLLILITLPFKIPTINSGDRSKQKK